MINSSSLPTSAADFFASTQDEEKFITEPISKVNLVSQGKERLESYQKRLKDTTPIPTLVIQNASKVQQILKDGSGRNLYSQEFMNTFENGSTDAPAMDASHFFAGESTSAAFGNDESSWDMTPAAPGQGDDQLTTNVSAETLFMNAPVAATINDAPGQDQLTINSSAEPTVMITEQPPVAATIIEAPKQGDDHLIMSSSTEPAVLIIEEPTIAAATDLTPPSEPANTAAGATDEDLNNNNVGTTSFNDEAAFVSPPLVEASAIGNGVAVASNEFSSVAYEELHRTAMQYRDTAERVVEEKKELLDQIAIQDLEIQKLRKKLALQASELINLEKENQMLSTTKYADDSKDDLPLSSIDNYEEFTNEEPNLT